MISSEATSRTVVPRIVTPLPGPAAQKLIEQDEHWTSPSYTRYYPLAVKRGYGAVIEDLDGNTFLDFTAGIAVTTTGHCHPRIVQAIQRQSEQLIHMCGADFYYPPLAHLAEQLCRAAPGPSPKRVLFSNSGTEAIEAAMKLARHHSGRPHFLAFYGGFHGRTLGALSLTASKITQRRRFEPLLPEVSHAAYGNCYRCPLNLEYGECGIDCVAVIERQIFRQKVSPDQVAAIIVEPIQGEGGYVVPPPEYHRELKAMCERHGILFIADEIQSGIGRTGRMFAMEHWGVEPDIICTAKGLASGLPLGAIIAKESVMTWPPGSHASTFGGNPVACAAALETLALLNEGLMSNATTVGAELLDGLRAIATRHTCIGDVRGIGLMIGVEFVQSRELKTPAPVLRDAVLQAAFRRGLILLGCGETTIRFCPALTIDSTDVATAVRILDEAIVEATGSRVIAPAV
jgi:4-aminobutyrate aminotransferase